MKTMLSLCLILAACTAEPNVESFETTQALYASNRGLSNEIGPDYCINWFGGGPCWGMGLYSIGNKQGSNTSTMTAPPAPAAQVIITMSMSNLVQMEDSLAVRVSNLVRCAKSGQTTDLWIDPNHVNYDNCDVNLAIAGYSPQDVALVLTIPAHKYPFNPLTSVRTYAQFRNSDAVRLRSNLLAQAAAIKIRYPNASLGFISRAWAPPFATNKQPEPYAFESGLATRWAIASQNYNTNAFMFWVAYNWNDTDPASYYKTDGIHPSLIGAGVRAEAIKQGLEASPFLPWYSNRAVGSATWACDLIGCDFALIVDGNTTMVRLP